MFCIATCTLSAVDVSVSNLRAHLSDWLDRVQDGEDVVVTDRGTPVARIVQVTASDLLEDLEKEGLLARPTSSQRPRAGDFRRVRAKRSVAHLVSDQRD
jgi:prevent-host-death family protein